MIEFKIRAYGRMELAQLYSPELTGIAAYRKMNKWIVRCPGLQVISRSTVLTLRWR